MPLLVDSDAFCKLGMSGLFDEVLEVLGAGIGDCRRLQALPQMLRKGSLIRAYGAESCAEILPLAERIQSIQDPDPIWLDQLVGIPSIDPGEAQMFAIAAQDTLVIITGDKRALHALKDINGYPEALDGRIVVLEAILMVLCERLGHAEVRRRLGILVDKDKTLQVCFSDGNPDPIRSLESYYRDLVAKVHPLRLWESTVGET